MSKIPNLILTPEIGIGLGIIILACVGFSLVGYVHRGRIITQLTAERDEYHATATRLHVQLAEKQDAYTRVANTATEILKKAERLGGVLLQFYKVTVAEAERRGIMKDKSIPKAIETANVTADGLINIGPDIKLLAERVIALNAEERQRLDAHDKRIHEEVEWALAGISLGGYDLAETCKGHSAETRAVFEKHVHAEQVNALIRLSTTCHYLKMSDEAYALELDKIIERDRHVLRRFLELDPHIVHSYPEGYLLAVRRLAS